MFLLTKCSQCGKERITFTMPEPGICKKCESSIKKNMQKVCYYDEAIEFNTRWVSVDYGVSTAAIIKQLRPGAPIRITYSSTAFRDGEHLKVFANGHQIGWVPVIESDRNYDNLVSAVKLNLPVHAIVKCTGKSDSQERDIWWCVVTADYKVQYISTGDEVYMALHSNRYHSRIDCGVADKRYVPLSIAKEYGKIPCPKCIQNQE